MVSWYQLVDKSIERKEKPMLFPATYEPATLTRDVTFGHQSGARSRSKVLYRGSQVRVRYNEREGRFDASAVLDDQPMVKKDLNPNAFVFNVLK
jgi:hypothetical protein